MSAAYELDESIHYEEEEENDHAEYSRDEFESASVTETDADAAYSEDFDFDGDDVDPGVQDEASAEPELPPPPPPLHIQQLQQRLSALMTPTSSKEDESMRKREHQSLGLALKAVEAELHELRRQYAAGVAAQLTQVKGKRKRAEWRRVCHVQELATARREAELAKASDNSLRERIGLLQKRAEERDVLLDQLRGEVTRSRELAAERAQQVERLGAELAASCEEVRRLGGDLSRVIEEKGARETALSEELRTACSKHQLECSILNASIERRERLLEERQLLLPERHQATLEAELERVRRWEARLEAESSALKHREVIFAQERANMHAEATTLARDAHRRALEESEVVRSSLDRERRAFEAERRELSQHVASTEARTQVERTLLDTKMEELRADQQKLSSDRAALKLKEELLSPMFDELQKQRTQLEVRQKEADSKDTTLKEKQCVLEEAERALSGREAEVNSKWLEITRIAKEEREARFQHTSMLTQSHMQLHERQVEVSAQVSEARKLWAEFQRTRMPPAPASSSYHFGDTDFLTVPSRSHSGSGQGLLGDGSTTVAPLGRKRGGESEYELDEEEDDAKTLVESLNGISLHLGAASRAKSVLGGIRQSISLSKTGMSSNQYGRSKAKLRAAAIESGALLGGLVVTS